MTRKVSRLGCALAVLWSFTPWVQAQVKVTVDYNPSAAKASNFKFKRVPAPARDDAAVTAKFTLVEGQIDSGSAGLSALVDGILPTAEDEPGANLFFRAGSMGGRLRIDLGSMIEVGQINTYSWHPNSRGPQLYKLYASDGADPRFNADPKRPIDPTTSGWKLITTVSTIAREGEDGGQYGVSITGDGGVLGKYRYLLFDVYPTEISDDWGNTFYSEIDVVAKK